MDFEYRVRLMLVLAWYDVDLKDDNSCVMVGNSLRKTLVLTSTY